MRTKTVLAQANALAIPLPDNTVHCVVTSPPYWQLRDYGVGVEEGEMGLEPFADCLGWATGYPCGVCHVCNLVGVFREVRRVLHPSGTVWLNYGDMFATEAPRGFYGDQGDTSTGRHGELGPQRNLANLPQGVKKGDRLLMHGRVALALQADGWWLRHGIIWHKPNPLPGPAQSYRRPVDSYELVYLLAKDYGRYYYDALAVKEPAATEGYPTRHLRDVWTIPTQGNLGAHFAVYPEDLVRPCVQAATSEYGVCRHCKAPWRRVTEKDGQYQARWAPGSAALDEGIYSPGGVTDTGMINTYKTVGWEPTCDCTYSGEIEPAVVMDPFVGSGTTVKVARELGRVGVGLDISLEYLLSEAAPRLIYYNGITPTMDRLHKIVHSKDGAADVGLEALPLFAGA